MRVLVTGGSSLLGRKVAKALAQRGDAVSCFQRSASGSGLPDRLGDIRDRSQVLAAAEGVDAIVHLAALVAPKPRWDDAFDINVLGTDHVIEAAARCGRLVHVSSPSVAFNDGPAVGERSLPAIYGGNDAYARSKAIAERSVLAASSVPTVVLRPHLVWGPGDVQLVGRIIDRARQGRLVLPDHGVAMIDTTYIDDAASAIVAGLDHAVEGDDACGRPWVVTGGDPRPVVELVEGILAAAGVEGHIRSAPAPLAAAVGRLVELAWRGDEPPLTQFAARQLSVAHWFDQREVRAVLGWEPLVGIDEGFRRLAQFYAQPTA